MDDPFSAECFMPLIMPCHIILMRQEVVLDASKVLHNHHDYCYLLLSMSSKMILLQGTESIVAMCQHRLSGHAKSERPA